MYKILIGSHTLPIKRNHRHDALPVTGNAVASELWGTMYIVPPKFRTCTPCTPQVKDAAYVKILSKRL